MPLHKNLNPGDVHKSHNYEYTNASTRNSATGFDTSDIGKIARQTDDETFYVLTTTAPTWVEITNRNVITVSQDYDGYLSFFTGTLAISGDNDLYWDRVNNRLGIHNTSPNESLTLGSSNAGGVISLNEVSEVPTNTSSFGKLYVKSADSLLYFKDDGGTEYSLTAGGISASQASDGYLTFFTSSSTIAGDNDLYWDRGNNRLGIHNETPNESLTIGSSNAGGVISLNEVSEVPTNTTNFGKLYVKSSDSKLYFKDDGGTEYNLTSSVSATQGSDGYLAFFTGSATIAGDNDLYYNRESGALALMGDGKFGLGVLVPGVAVDIRINTTSNSTATNFLRVFNDYNNAAATTAGFGSGIQFRGNNGGGGPDTMGQIKCVWRDASSLHGAITFEPSVSGTPTEIMRIQYDSSNPRVGIGTGAVPAPSELLEINQNQNAFTNLLVKNLNTGSSAGAGISIESDGTAISLLSYGASAGGTFDGISRADSVVFRTSGSKGASSFMIMTGGIGFPPAFIHLMSGDKQIMSLATDSGYTRKLVGIGNNNPANSLEVIDSFTSGFGASTSDQMVYIKNTNTGNTATTLTLAPNSGSNFNIGIYGSGADGQANFAFINQRNNADLAIYTNNSERLRILSGGNIGLGTASPNEKLVVNGRISLQECAAPAFSDGYGKIYVHETDRFLHYVDELGTDNPITSAQQGADGYAAFFTSAGVIAGDNDLYWDRGNNRFGIGTSTPNEKLTIAGYLSLGNQDVDPAATTGYGKVYPLTDGNLYFVNSSGTQTQLNVETLFALTDFTNPSGNNGSLLYLNSSTSFTGSSTAPSSGDITYWNGSAWVYSGNGASNNDVLTWNGTAWVAQAPASDLRLKTNIQPIESPLNKIMAMRGIRYEWNDIAEQYQLNYKQGQPKIGLIAQEVEEVLPEIVNSSGKYKSIEYDKVVAVLIEAVKELKKEIEELKSNQGK